MENVKKINKVNSLFLDGTGNYVDLLDVCVIGPLVFREKDGYYSDRFSFTYYLKSKDNVTTTFYKSDYNLSSEELKVILTKCYDSLIERWANPPLDNTIFYPFDPLNE